MKELDEIIEKEFGIEMLKEMKETAINKCIDSLKFVRLLVRIENEFDIIFEDDDINMDVLSSYKKICDYLKYKKERKSNENV